MNLHIEEEKLLKLLEEKKWEEAKSLLDSYLNSDLSLEEKGAAYVAFVSTYLKMMANINQQYESILDSILFEINSNQAEIKRTGDKVRLTQLHKEIDAME